MDIVKTLDNLKGQREKLNKEINTMEELKEKVIERIRNFERELENTDGNYDGLK